MPTLQQVQQRIKEDNQDSKVNIYLSKVNSSTYLLFASPYPQAKPQFVKQVHNPDDALKEASKIRKTLERTLEPIKEEKMPSVFHRAFHLFKCYVSLT
jgi:hypothetical protein